MTPGMHSSQNEQDNRYLAKFAKVPMLEPSDSQECYDMVQTALDLSEELRTPVMVRTTTRIIHSSGIVDLGDFERREPTGLKYTKDIQRTVPVPMFARKMRMALEEKLEKLARCTERFALPEDRARRRPDRHNHERHRLSVCARGVSGGIDPEARDDIPDPKTAHQRLRFIGRKALRRRRGRALPGRADPRDGDQDHAAQDQPAHRRAQPESAASAGCRSFRRKLAQSCHTRWTAFPPVRPCSAPAAPTEACSTL